MTYNEVSFRDGFGLVPWAAGSKPKLLSSECAEDGATMPRFAAAAATGERVEAIITSNQNTSHDTTRLPRAHRQ
jgi:hypothetical protein